MVGFEKGEGTRKRDGDINREIMLPIFIYQRILKGTNLHH